MNIKEATKKDYPILKEIGMVCYKETVPKTQQSWLTKFLFNRYFSKNKFAERKKRGTFIYYLENENEIVGFYELENSGGLASLYVKPNHHKKGYGKALLMHALMKAKEIGCQEMFLDSSEFAHQFYKKMGFRNFGEAKVILGVWMQTMKIKID